MTQTTRESRRFSVHARDLGRHHARILREPSFEAAAIAFADDYVPHGDQEAEIGVIVRDIDSGHEHAFRIDLGAASERTNPPPRR